jgi:uncharacterized repeat protein (TIGR03803 family)
MTSRRIAPIIFKLSLAAFAVILLATGTAVGQETILFDFGMSGTMVDFPTSGPIMDALGNFYGVTNSGGTYNRGAVFELSPAAGGLLKLKVLHSFNPNVKDGSAVGSSLLLDTAGNLYGTTQGGGFSNGGTAFELVHGSNGGWSEKILHSFNANATDGAVPYASPILDSTGNLYGTTGSGGAHHVGTVFKLAPKSGGGWQETILYSFRNNRVDGVYPTGSLVLDSAGNLYGTTSGGGTLGNGTVFELTPVAGGGWQEKELYAFKSSSDGAEPRAGLLLDSSGNLYGTTATGGAGGGGTAFELSPGVNGKWTEVTLYSFTAFDIYEVGTLTFDSSGNLYGTTADGGTYRFGAVFKLSPASGGGWTATTLHTFSGGSDGETPNDGLILDASGKLCGTTVGGGTYGGGTVFQITP